MSTAQSSGSKEVELPPVVDGEHATIVGLELLEKKTRPPAHYTDGTLIEDMENAAKFVADRAFAKTLRSVSGLGTGATRNAIIDNLVRRGLLERIERRVNGKKATILVATAKGRELIDFLPEALYDVAETARWEATLDAISEGKASARDFERDIATQVGAHVAALKGLRRAYGSTNSQGAPMSDDAPMKPTEKMVAYAERLAERFKAELPEGYKDNAERCRAFLDEYGQRPFPPSDKQLAFAERIAKDKDLEIPDAARAEGKKLSAWIDDNK